MTDKSMAPNTVMMAKLHIWDPSLEKTKGPREIERETRIV